MLSDNLIIRPAREDEADVLSHLIFRSKGYWGYSLDLMDYWSEEGELSILREEIASSPVYLLEDLKKNEIIGFYSLRTGDLEWELKNLWVAPEYIGVGLGCKLFLHACEIAETAGAVSLIIVSDPHAGGFYIEMGAERIGEKPLETPQGTRYLPILRVNL